MLPFKEDAAHRDYRTRWNIAEAHFCVRPSFQNNTPLAIKSPDGLKELSFLFFIGWLFCGILNREKECIRPCLLPVGKNADTSLLVLSHPNSHLTVPAGRELALLDPQYFTCPLDRTSRPLTPMEVSLCPVVNKLRYNLVHARPAWDVSGLMEPARTDDCCKSSKILLWEYLEKTVCADPDVYGPMVGGSAFPIRLPFALLCEYLTGISPRTRDFGNLLEETLLWFGMARSGILMGLPHAVLTQPFECNEIDILLYECAGKTKTPSTQPPEGWARYIQDQAICVIELTIGHYAEEFGMASSEPKRQVGIGSGKDVPKNKLVNYLALSSIGFRLVQANYLSVVGDATMAPATRQALTSTPGFHYISLPDVLKEDIEDQVLNHHDNRVSVTAVRRWHAALIRVVEEISVAFAGKLTTG